MINTVECGMTQMSHCYELSFQNDISLDRERIKETYNVNYYCPKSNECPNQPPQKFMSQIWGFLIEFVKWFSTDLIEDSTTNS